uniref:Uncharacterized protein n=1 Tax=Strigamia maritima TaxID=126957 RepID=T1IY22_STRMM
MEEANTDEVPGNMLVNSKVKSPNQGREVTMENFQDGGPQHQHNMSTEQSGPYSNMDGPRLNSDMNNYSRDSGDQNAATDDYGKMNDTLNQGQMQAYGGGYNNRANYMADQHGGGAQLSANSTDNSSNSQYGQYNQQNVRPGYLQPSKAMSMGPPPRPPNSAMMLGYNTSPTQHQQRFLSGHSISQQGGPTPTLNQLLQSPNPVQRYHNSYGDYNMGQSLAKGPSDMVNTSQYPHNWNTNAASRGLNTPYSHQMASSAYRNQIRDIIDT